MLLRRWTSYLSSRPMRALSGLYWALQVIIGFKLADWTRGALVVLEVQVG
jgi:hypothetical protein